MANPHFLTGLGAAFAIFFSAAGSCTASVPSGMFAQNVVSGFWAFPPIIISGVLAIYGCIIGVLLSRSLSLDNLSEVQGYRNLTAGLAVGLACLASGLGLARFIENYMMDALYPTPNPNNINDNSSESELRDGLLTNRIKKKPFDVTKRFLMVLVFIEAIGLYGLIVALLMIGKSE